MVRKKTLENGLVYYLIDKEAHIKLIKAKVFYAICDSCNTALNDHVYYVPVLHWGMCEKCFEDWSKRATAYDEDKWFEDVNVSNFEKMLGLFFVKLER